MSTNRKVVYTLQINSNVSQILGQAEKDAIKFDNTMWQIQKTLSSFGVGLGAHYLIDAAKTWTQGAADFEAAMLRIKNASDTPGASFKNQLFINKEVDDFKLKLQEASDSYGDFLFKIKNAGLSNDQKSKLYDDILTVSKVANIPLSEMESTIRNTGIMLGEGVLEARHLRGLSYTHPQLVPYIADALGLESYKKDAFSKLLHIESEGDITNVSKEQELSRLISSGKLTKASIPANIILEAYDKYAASVRDKLPETLQTVNSELNVLSNTWERFKNSLVLDHKQELVSFFHSVEGGIGFLVEHENDIFKIGSAIKEIIELYAAWKIGMFALQGGANIVQFLRGETTLFATEQAKLNSILDAYAGTNALVAQTENELLESKLANTEITEQQIINSESEIVSLQQRQVELDKLALSLNEVSVQMDLFTDAQLINESNFQRVFYDMELYNGEIHRLQIGLKEGSVQGSLFTDSELEMTAAITSAGDALALENEQLAIRNGLIADGAAMSNINTSIALQQLSAGSLGSGLLGSLGLNASNISSAISSVFIVGMTAEVATQLLPKGRFNNDEIGLTDYLFGAAQLMGADKSPGGWVFGGNRGLNKMNNIALQEAQYQNLQSYLNGAFPDGTQVGAKGNNLYNAILAVQALHPEFDLVSGLGIKPDMHGKMDTSNANIYQLLQNKHLQAPFIEEDSTGTEGGKVRPVSLSDFAKILGKNTSHIRGNSTNYFTVHIDEMNGVKTFQVTSTNPNMTTEQVAKIAGDAVLKMLVDAVNDSQQVKQH